MVNSATQKTVKEHKVKKGRRGEERAIFMSALVGVVLSVVHLPGVAGHPPVPGLVP